MFLQPPLQKDARECAVIADAEAKDATDLSFYKNTPEKGTTICKLLRLTTPWPVINDLTDSASSLDVFEAAMMTHAKSEVC